MRGTSSLGATGLLVRRVGTSHKSKSKKSVTKITSKRNITIQKNYVTKKHKQEEHHNLEQLGY
jgi:hypothetical protein